MTNHVPPPGPSNTIIRDVSPLHALRDAWRVVGTDHRGVTIDVFVAPPTRWQRVRRWVVNMVTLK